MRNANRAGILAAALAMLGLTPGPALGDIAIRELKGRERIRIELKDATLDEALDALAKRFEFQVRVTGTISGEKRLTTELEGEPVAVVRRLLRHTNHILELASERPIGIARIVVIGMVGQPPKQPTATPPTGVRPGMPGTMQRPGQPPRPAPVDEDDDPDGGRRADGAPRPPPGPPPEEDDNAAGMPDDDPGPDESGDDG